MELELQETKASLTSPENGLLQEPGTSPESSFIFLTCLLLTKSTMIESAKRPLPEPGSVWCQQNYLL